MCRYNGNGHKPLSSKEVEAQEQGMENTHEIWNEFLKARGDHYHNQLIEHYRHLVKDVADSHIPIS